jgi:diguanylate cyclase (GGDEF)-like protein
VTRAVTKGSGKMKTRRATTQAEIPPEEAHGVIPREKVSRSGGDLSGGAEARRPIIPFEVVIVEANGASQQRATALCTELGYRIALETEPEALRERVRTAPPQAVLIGLPDHAPLAIELASLTTPDRPVIIASMPGPATMARERALLAGVDLLAIRPHSRDHLAAVLAAAERITLLAERLRTQRASEERLQERLRRVGESDLATGFFHIEFFERVLVMELKRARRYDYPLAACIVGLDPWLADPRPAPLPAHRLRADAAAAIAKIVRDIDLPVDLAEDRMLVFLPYTDVDGASVVGKRIARAVAGCSPVGDRGRIWQPSVSIGIAALTGGKQMSFAKLVKDAQAALKAAQAKGGGAVVARR